MRNRQLQPGFHQLQAPEYSCSLSLLCNMPTLIKLMQMGQALGGSLKLSSVYKLRLYISAPCLEVCQKQAIYTMLIFYYTACKQRPIYAKYKESMLSAQFLELFCMLSPSDQRDGQGSALYILLLLLFIHTFRQRHMFRKVSVIFLRIVLCKIVFFISMLGHTGFLSCCFVWPKVEVFVSEIDFKSVHWHKGNAYATCKKVMSKITTYN